MVGTADIQAITMGVCSLSSLNVLGSLSLTHLSADRCCCLRVYVFVLCVCVCVCVVFSYYPYELVYVDGYGYSSSYYSGGYGYFGVRLCLSTHSSLSQHNSVMFKRLFCCWMCV
jgi:hypothetical protein